MEAELKKTSIDRYDTVYSACFSREETAESVVPDVLPDIARIIDTDACVYLRGKETVNGRATVTGSLECTVIYLPEGERGLRRLNLTMPFSASVDAPEIKEGCRMVARLSLNSADARLLNPRKVLVRADVCVCLNCYARGSLELTKEIPEGNGVQSLSKTANVSSVTGVNEKTFVLSDEYQLSPSKPPMGEPLKQKATVYADDIKTVGNKLVFKGVAKVSLLYAASEDGRPVTEDFSTNFSQILELEGTGEEPVTILTIMLTGAYFEPKQTSNGTNALSVELHLVAQAESYQTSEVSYVADAYSCGYPSQVQTENLDLERVERELTLREAVRELIETPEPVREVVAVYVFLGSPDVELGKVTAPISIQALYRTEDGSTSSVSRKLNVESRVDLEPGTNASVSDMRCAEVYASPAAGGLELRLPVEMSVLVTAKVSLQSVAGMSLDMDNPISTAGRPSVMVVNAGGKDIWNIAKKYLTTPDLISAANPEMTENGVLLIPRTR